MDAYFDTNVYGHIYRREDGVTAPVVDKLEEAVKSQDLRVFTNFPVIEETNAARLKNLDETNGRFELIRMLTVWEDLIIKRQPEIIDGDIRAYLNDEAPPSKFQAPYPRCFHWQSLTHTLGTDRTDRPVGVFSHSHCR